MPFRGILKNRGPLFGDDFLAKIRERMGDPEAVEGVDYPSAAETAGWKSDDTDRAEVDDDSLEALRARALGGSASPSDLSFLRAAERQHADDAERSAHASRMAAQIPDLAQPVESFDSRPGQEIIRFRSPRGGPDMFIPREFGSRALPGAREAAAKFIASQPDKVTDAERQAFNTSPLGYVQYKGPIRSQSAAGPGPEVSLYSGGRTSSGESAQFQIPTGDKQAAHAARERLKEERYGILPGPTQDEMYNRQDDTDAVAMAAQQMKMYAQPGALDRVRALRAEAAQRKADYAALAAAPMSPPTRR